MDWPLFQSTLPVWGATARGKRAAGLLLHFNPRSPCGERPVAGVPAQPVDGQFQSTLPVWGATLLPAQVFGAVDISIHAPRVGSDGVTLEQAEEDKKISIHAPRVGSDCYPAGSEAGRHDFNPRSPCGERQPAATPCALPSTFQSTLPVWGATSGDFAEAPEEGISIHAPRVGSDHYQG